GGAGGVSCTSTALDSPNSLDSPTLPDPPNSLDSPNPLDSPNLPDPPNLLDLPDSPNSLRTPSARLGGGAG
ncbi:MAG: hypothetical protein AAF845_13010, partial [Bacteroidota bacterium]